jgi:hypothetical protein
MLSSTMPLLIKLDNKRMWDRPEWLPAGEVPAEAVQDFRADGNELSVWYVEPDHSNLDRVLTAIAANREHFEKIDYAVFDDAIVDRCEITIRPTPGQLPDEHASRTWHRDLVELSGRKLVSLAESIAAGSAERKPMNQIRDLLSVAARVGHIKKELMKDGLAAKLQWSE